jgi:SAM-dependent methyltransferase
MPEYSVSDDRYASDKDILSVQDFYNTLGWKKGAWGDYFDYTLFSDQRDVARSYKQQYAERIFPFLNKQGKYLLDIASGPVYQEVNKQYGKNFEYRICMDISVEALKGAQQNLKDHQAYFIVGDITNIPLRDNCCDNVMSNHTLYHVPRHKQPTAVQELVRVCAPGSKVIISYNWGWHSMIMNISLFPFRLIRFVRRLQKIYLPESVNKQSGAGLYFYSHSPGFFIRNKPESCKLEFSVLNTLHEDFIKIYLSRGKWSRKFLDFLLKLENRYPKFFGKHGAFGLMVYQKISSSNA